MPIARWRPGWPSMRRSLSIRRFRSSAGIWPGWSDIWPLFLLFQRVHRWVPSCHSLRRRRHFINCQLFLGVRVGSISRFLWISWPILRSILTVLANLVIYGLHIQSNLHFWRSFWVIFVALAHPILILTFAILGLLQHYCWFTSSCGIFRRLRNFCSRGYASQSFRKVSSCNRNWPYRRNFLFLNFLGLGRWANIGTPRLIYWAARFLRRYAGPAMRWFPNILQLLLVNLMYFSVQSSILALFDQIRLINRFLQSPPPTFLRLQARSRRKVDLFWFYISNNINISILLIYLGVIPRYLILRSFLKTTFLIQTLNSFLYWFVKAGPGRFGILNFGLISQVLVQLSGRGKIAVYCRFLIASSYWWIALGVFGVFLGFCRGLPVFGVLRFRQKLALKRRFAGSEIFADFGRIWKFVRILWRALFILRQICFVLTLTKGSFALLKIGTPDRARAIANRSHLLAWFVWDRRAVLGQLGIVASGNSSNRLKRPSNVLFLTLRIRIHFETKLNI